MPERAYKVLKIDEMVRADPLIGLSKYYRYTIMTRGGVRLTVDVDEKDSTEEKATPILTKRAEQIDRTL